MMQLPQLLFALVCVLFGIVPSIVFHLMQQVMDSSRQAYGTVMANATSLTGGWLAGVQEAQDNAIFVPLALALLVALMFLLTYIISKLGSVQRRTASPWLCGYVSEADCYRYTAHNFYGEIKRYFRWLGGTTHPNPGSKNEAK
jgi:small basic protein